MLCPCYNCLEYFRYWPTILLKTDKMSIRKFTLNLKCLGHHGQSGLCEQKMVMVSNGGQPLSGPKIQPNGDLLLEYVEGEKCADSDNSSKRFSVLVVLHCSNTDEVCFCCGYQCTE